MLPPPISKQRGVHRFISFHIPCCFIRSCLLSSSLSLSLSARYKDIHFKKRRAFLSFFFFSSFLSYFKVCQCSREREKQKSDERACSHIRSVNLLGGIWVCKEALTFPLLRAHSWVSQSVRRNVYNAGKQSRREILFSFFSVRRRRLYRCCVMIPLAPLTPHLSPPLLSTQSHVTHLNWLVVYLFLFIT